MIPATSELQSQTYSNRQTDSLVSNYDFVKAIFDLVAMDAKARPLVCCKRGDPSHGAWNPKPFPCDTGNEDLNWYATPALFTPDSKGRYLAQKKFATSVHCMVLDDVGTKIALKQLDGCPPTWLLETSPGNHQAGYVFEAPLMDMVQADALKAAFIRAGLCDPGATGAASRWYRLPVGVNGKAAYGHPSPRCNLISWRPELRYTVDSLVMAFDLHLVAPEVVLEAPTGVPKFVHTEPAVSVSDGIHVPKPTHHPVIAALQAQGLYKACLGPGKHDITCPWVHEHTDAVDHGTAYFEASPLFPKGGFKCQHAHGSRYHLGHLLQRLNIDPEAANHRSTIKVLSGELHRIVSAAEGELAATGRYYQRGGAIVTITFDPATLDPLIQVVSQAHLLQTLSREVQWVHPVGPDGDLRVCDPPGRHVNVLLDQGQYAQLQVLNGLARQPFLAEGGRLVMHSGYDQACGMYSAFEASRFSIPVAPSRADAELALHRIRALLSEFAFAQAHDEAAAMAAILTAATRPGLSKAPMFHIKAASYGSGKSYLTSVISAFCGPGNPTILAFPSDEAECQKLLLSTLKLAPAVVVFDNLTDDLLPFKSLCTALTEAHMTGRELGVSQTATVGTRTLFLSSGNNVDAVRDMARRTLTIVLDPQVENPASRLFQGNPLNVMHERREEFVADALTIVRAWLVAGSPIAQCPPMNSFEQWSMWVRQPLLWLGMPDPAVRSFEQQAQDPEREMIARFMLAWRGTFGRIPTMVREAVNQSTASMAGANALELREAMKEIADERGEINRRRLGKWMSRHQGRIVNGMKLVRAPGNFSAERWAVQLVSEVKSVCIHESANNHGSEVPF